MRLICENLTPPEPPSCIFITTNSHSLGKDKYATNMTLPSDPIVLCNMCPCAKNESHS